MKELENKINGFIKNNLDLELNLSKTKLLPISKGIDFLGYFVKFDYILVRQRVVARLKDKLLKCNLSQNDKWGNIDIDKVKILLATVNSYYGHFIHAFTYNLRKDIFENHLGKLKENFLAKEFYYSIKHVKK